MRGPAPLALAALVALGACRDEAYLTFDRAEPGDLVIVAVSSGGSAIRSVERFVYRPDQRPRAIAPGDVLHGFVLKPADLIGPGGEPLEPAMFAGVEVRSGPISARGDGEGVTGSCGRCLVRPRGAQAIVYPGDLCPLPDAALGFGWPNAAAPAEVRSALALAWPGPCPCGRFSGETNEGDLDARLLARDGVEAVEPIDTSAQADDGTLVTIARGRVYRTPPGGPSTEVGPTLLPGDTLPGVAAVGDRFVLEIGRISNGEEERAVSLRAFDASFHQIGAPSAAVALVPRGIASFSGGGIALLGRAPENTEEDNVPIASCSIEAAGPVCETIAPRRIFEYALRGKALVSGLELPGGTIVLVSDGRGLAYFDRWPKPGSIRALIRDEESDALGLLRGRIELVAGDDVRWAAKAIDSADLPERAVIAKAANVGRRLFLCVQDYRSFDPDARVMTASITSSVFESAGADAGRRFETLACVARRRCAGFLPVPGRSDATRLLLEGGVSFDLDGDGRIIAGSAGSAGQCDAQPVTADLPGVGRPAARVHRGAAGWGVIETEDHVLFARAPGAPAFLPIRGEAGPAPRAAGALIVDPSSGSGRALAFWTGGAVDEIEATSSPVAPVQIAASRELQGFDPADVVLAAAADRKRGDVVLVGANRTSGRSFIRRVVSAAESADEIDLGPASGRTLLDVAERTPGRHVLIASGRGLFELDGAAVTEIRFSWDDPDTDDREAAPEPDPECLRRRAIDPRVPVEDDLLRSVDADHGVAWVLGCRNTLIRVDAKGAARIAPARVFPNFRFEPEPEHVSFLSARAICPDSAAFMIGIRHAFKDAVREVSQLVMLEGEEYDATSVLFTQGWASEIAGDERTLRALLWDSERTYRGRIVDLPNLGVRFSGIDAFVASARIGGVQLAATAGGRLYTIAPAAAR